jgi:hypothetical protein
MSWGETISNHELLLVITKLLAVAWGEGFRPPQP